MIRARSAAFTASIAASGGLLAWGAAGGLYGAKPMCMATAAAAAAAAPTGSPSVVLYQYKICPFCNRVKAYLDFLNIKYDTVEVNPLTKSQLSFQKTSKKVPLITIGDTTLAESSAIIDEITSRVRRKGFDSSVTLSDKFFPDDTQKWSEWSEKQLAVMLYPNITRSFQESWECFSYAGEVEDWDFVQRSLVRYVSPPFMYLANGKIKKKYGIEDERKELNVVIKVWCDAVGQNKFLHGDHITMPDIQVFGVLRSIKGQRTFDEIMKEHSQLKDWYDRVQSELSSRKSG